MTAGLKPFGKQITNEKVLTWPYIIQYSIYLFERILLYYKDVNPTKHRHRIIGRNKEKPLTNLKGKPRLELKDRIFIANVTKIVSLSKTGLYLLGDNYSVLIPIGVGSYTIQIFWKGGSGVENIIIRFQSEEIMRKWYQAIDLNKINQSRP